MGLGLKDFLNHGDSGGGFKKEHRWTKDGRIDIWLPAGADFFYPSYNHPFYEFATWKDKEGEEKEGLRFVRFVSPDPDRINSDQHFRVKDSTPDVLKLPPLNDPFLLLREWLRHEYANDKNLDDVVFHWTDPSPRKGFPSEHNWTVGELSRLVKRQRHNSNHSLDTKLDYLFVVLIDSDPDAGLQVVRNPKLLGDSMREEIKQIAESEGEDAANPQEVPWCFRWVYDDNATNPMKSYRAFRFSRAELTDQKRELLATPRQDIPHPYEQCSVQPGDRTRIMAAMQAAAQMDLPWDRIFPDTWKNDDAEDPASFDFGANAKDGGEKKQDRATTSNKTSGPPKGAATRRRKKKAADPPPKPKVETIPCDECGHEMPVTEAKCEKCGAEYEIDEDPGAGASQQTSASATSSSDEEEELCWNCQKPDIVNGRCENCGIEVADDIPH